MQLSKRFTSPEILKLSSKRDLHISTKTLKTMVGITPNGVVSYVSSAYGGSASDRQII